MLDWIVPRKTKTQIAVNWLTILRCFLVQGQEPKASVSHVGSHAACQNDFIQQEGLLHSIPNLHQRDTNRSDKPSVLILAITNQPSSTPRASCVMYPVRPPAWPPRVLCVPYPYNYHYLTKCNSQRDFNSYSFYFDFISYYHTEECDSQPSFKDYSAFCTHSYY